MGAWIEMAGCAGGCHYAWVAPFMGAWIEMIRSSMKTGTGKRSHPSRVRGLKSDTFAGMIPAGVASHPSRVRGVKYRYISTKLISFIKEIKDG